MTSLNLEGYLKNEKELLIEYSDKESVINELSNYCYNAFNEQGRFIIKPSHLSDESFVSDWMTYLEEAQTVSILEVLKSKLVPLNFPIRKGMSQNRDYRDATLKGKATANMPEASGLALTDPKKITLEFTSGRAGSIPVLIIGNDHDFQSILQALVFKNEPMPIPKSMGASMIKGLNNWDRMKKAIKENQRDLNSGKIQISNIIYNKELYQDKLMLVSQKPYSNIIPDSTPLQEWCSKSVQIRIEHEYTHYSTLRQFGVMNQNMHDELLADYKGIHAISEVFDADLFLKFIGLESYPEYRSGGRLENYPGSTPLSDDSFIALCKVMHKAAHNVQSFDQGIIAVKNAVINTDLSFWIISQFSLLELASDDAVSLLTKAYSHFNNLSSSWTRA